MRLFVAIEVTDRARADVGRLIERLRSSSASVRWTRAEELHVTLNFLGDVSEDQLADVIRVVDRAADRHRPSTIELQSIGAFPDARSPAVVWVGVTDETGLLRELQADLETELEVLGFGPEHRRYRPHLTIGRVKGDAKDLRSLIEANAGFNAGAVPVVQVVVFSSTTDDEGRQYTPLSRSPLRSSRRGIA